MSVEVLVAIICLVVSGGLAAVVVGVGIACAIEWFVERRHDRQEILCRSEAAVMTDMRETAKQLVHYSDCALHNEPAKPAGPCDCGLEGRILQAITTAREEGRAELDRLTARLEEADAFINKVAAADTGVGDFKVSRKIKKLAEEARALKERGT